MCQEALRPLVSIYEIRVFEGRGGDGRGFPVRAAAGSTATTQEGMHAVDRINVGGVISRHLHLPRDHMPYGGNKLSAWAARASASPARR